MLEVLFGNRVAEKCLLYIANYGEGYITGIAKTYGSSPSQVKKQLERLEAGGILVHQMAGNTKMFMINPRLVYKKDLYERASGHCGEKKTGKNLFLRWTTSLLCLYSISFREG